ncbi:MAG: HDIG domain-containing protein, partial [Deltaproteobacteria bacterium]|nr:HDIG domain-containing protein [Deltaproteobacteria bacterium]
MEQRKHAFNDFIISGNTVRWSILVLVTVIFTIIFYPNLATKQHSYQLGDVVERDIKAPKDFLVQDDMATEESRKRAVESVLTIYDHNTTLLSKLTKKIQSAFGIVQQIMNAENQMLLQNQPHRPGPESEGAAEHPVPKVSVQDMVWQKKAEFEEKIDISVSKEAYRILENNQFSTEIPALIVQILTAILDNGVVANKKILMTESDKGITLRDLSSKTETAVFNLKQFYSLDQSKAMVRIIGQPLLKEMHYTLLNLIVDFSQRLIQPNITLNQSATEERKEKAAGAILPILYKIKAGEMLLREGERVTQIHLLKLENMQAQTSDDQAIANGLGVALLVFCLLLITYLSFLHNHPIIDRNYNKSVLFLASVLIIFLIIIKLSAILSHPMALSASYAFSVASMTGAIPVAAGAMTICLFMGFQFALPFAFILSALTAILFQNHFEIFIYFFLSSLMGAFWTQNCRERKNLIKAGVKLGFLNLILASVINLYMGELAGLKLLWDWAFAMLGGISAGIVCLGITPLFEIAFRYTTDITLLELANLDQPILKRLVLEAPGTYHHSILVGTMVEAAASEIGANPLLAKVCAYYHDIGKLKNPLYFIENQAGGKNRH